MVAADASALYARNVLDFLKLIVDKEARYTLNLEDDIVAACLMCKDGQVIREAA
jgi:NAD(P) transhydrogenase subunit alpha